MFDFLSNVLKNYPDWLLLLTTFVAALWTVRSLVLSLFQSFRGSIGALIGLALLGVTLCVYIQVASSVPAGSENWAIGLSIGGAILGVLAALHRLFLEQQTLAMQRALQDVSMIVSPASQMDDAQRIKLLRTKFGYSSDEDPTLAIVNTGDAPGEESDQDSSPPEASPDAS